MLFANPCFWYKGFCFRAFLLTICHQRQREGVKQCPPRREINKYIEVSLYHYEGGEFVLHLMRNVKLSKRVLLSFIFHQCTLFSPQRCCLPWSGLSKWTCIIYCICTMFYRNVLKRRCHNVIHNEHAYLLMYVCDRLPNILKRQCHNVIFNKTPQFVKLFHNCNCSIQ